MDKKRRLGAVGPPKQSPALWMTSDVKLRAQENYLSG